MTEIRVPTWTYMYVLLMNYTPLEMEGRFLKYGQSGWEFVGSYVAKSDETVFIFKRQNGWTEV